MKKKRFLTYDEQIAFLKEKKNLEIPDEDYAKQILFQTGYFPLINGYKEAYKNPATNQFYEGIAFEDIYELYQFDEILAAIAVKPNIVQFFISVFSKGENISPSYSDILNEPDLKVPFTIQEGEIENYSIPDIRVSGFGPLYSGIFLITVGVGIAILVDYIRNKKYDSLIKYLIIIGVSAVLLIALDGSYWARYVPYVYLISAMNLAYLFEKNTKVSNILGIVIAVIMAINSALVLKVALNNYIGNSKYVKNNLIQFQEYAKDKEKIPIKLNLDTYQGVQYNLDDLGIDIILDNSITSERDGFLFKY